MDFKSMMANREKTIIKNAKDFVTGGFKKDERFWELGTDKAGNGSAIIRFLPQKNFELNPIVTRIRHAFKRKGKQFWALCPKTLGWDEECPVCDELNPLYDEYVDTPKGKKYTHQEQIDLLRRKKEFITNILVIDDPNNPDNNGKVFLFKINGVIMEMITKAINPPAEMINPVIVYDYLIGANFQYICIAPTKKGDFNDYKSSSFQAPTPLSEDSLENIWNKTYELEEFTAEKLFESYDDLDKKFRKIYFNETTPKEIPGDTDSKEKTEIDNPFENDEDAQKEDVKSNTDDFSFEDQKNEEMPDDISDDNFKF